MQNRLPLTVVRATGADVHNPKRYADYGEPEGDNPALGDPPALFDEFQRAVWAQFKTELFWLTEADRALVEVATMLRAKFYISPNIFGLQDINTMIRIMSVLGGTPTTRTKVGQQGGQNKSGAKFGDKKTA